MLDEQLKKLGIEYQKLDPVAQKECEDIISKLIGFVEYSIQFKKPYLQEINKYLHKKSNRDKSKYEPLDNMSKVRNLLLRGKPTSEHHNFLEPLVWKVLFRLDSFNDLERLCNFLGNYLQVDIKDDEKVRLQIKNQLLNNKDEVILAYKKLYDNFPREKQEYALRELGRGVFITLKGRKLKPFNELLL
jgi:hypothetical protein